MPPTITKQLPPKPTFTPAQTNGSILGTAVPVTSLVEDWMKVVLYGRNRVGKTTLACQFPKPLLLVSFEPDATGGAMSVSRMEGVHMIRVQPKPIDNPKTKKPEGEHGIRKSQLLCQELAAHNPFPFKTVVIDSATSLEDMLLMEICNWDRIPEMKKVPNRTEREGLGIASKVQYQERSGKAREMIRDYLSLPCHVVITAKERDHAKRERMENGDFDMESRLTRGLQQNSFIAPSMGGATVDWLYDACGYMCQMYEDEEFVEQDIPAPLQNGVPMGPATKQLVSTGRRVRRLRTIYHANFAAGFRSPNPKAVKEYIQADSPEDMYDKMMKVARGVEVK